ncbi:ferritin family protein [candidate division WOR-3 bacterium]|nr:ferritin family protein [candidate division WOR-3 bacterium]
MSKISPAVVEAIKIAIQMEKDGRRFYEECVKKTENQLGKEMFESLVQDEITHLNTFQKMFNTITETEEWREFAEVSPKVGKIPIFEGEIEKKADANPSDLDAIRIAMDNERKSIDHYRKAANEAEDPLAVKIFNKIREEEEYHYDPLQAQRDYLTKSGFWFDVSEFRMDAKY